MYRHHLAFAYEKSTGEQVVYVDGKQDACNAGVTPLQGSRDVFISYPENIPEVSSKFSMNGSLSNLQAWHCRLTEDEILETMKVPWNMKGR